MDETTYIKKNKPELKMPKTDPFTGRDSSGIRFEGPVLSGLVGVQQNLQLHAVNSPQTSAQIREIAPGGLTYISPEKYINSGQDPRLVRDPFYSAQDDPVIRYHLNLPPLPEKHKP